MNSVSNNSPNFGMALKIPDKTKLTKKLGCYVANDIERVKPEIKKLAKDTNITIKPQKYVYPQYGAVDVLDIKVQKIIKNPVKRFLSKLGLVKNPSLKTDSGFLNSDSVGNNLLNATKDIVKKLHTNA